MESKQGSHVEVKVGDKVKAIKEATNGDKVEENLGTKLEPKCGANVKEKCNTNVEAKLD